MPAVHAADVSIYGVIASGLVYQDNEHQDNPNFSMAAYTQLPEQPRWGIRARENLDNGLYVGAQLESGFHTDTGALIESNLIFGRGARVFVGYDQVEMSLGRIAGFTVATKPYSVYGRLRANMTMSSLPGLAPANLTYQPGELSNAVAITTTNPKGLFVQGIYSNGNSIRGVDSESLYDWDDRQHTAQTAVGWVGEKVRIGAVYSWERQAKPDAQTVRKNDTHGLHLIGSYDFGGPAVSAVLYVGRNDWRIGPVPDTGMILGAGNSAAGNALLKQSKDGLETVAGFVSAVYPMGRHELSGALGYLKAEWKGRKNALQSDTGSAFMGGMLYRYHLSKTTYLYGSLSYCDGRDLLGKAARFNQIFGSSGLVYHF